MTEHQEQNFENEYDKFVASGFFYTAKDATGRWTLVEALNRLRKYTKAFIEKHNSGMSSQSAFSIIKDELLAEPDPNFRIVPIALDGESEETSELTVQQYRQMPVRQIQMKYRNDPVFKAQVEKLIADGLI
jgi:hypothetical protein